jgi:hypothetical protein
MNLIDQKHFRGATKEFIFAHKVAGKKKTFETKAINLENGQRKVWDEIRKEYKQINAEKKARKIARARAMHNHATA